MSTPQIVTLKRSRNAIKGALTRLRLKVDHIEPEELGSESLEQIITAQSKLDELDQKFTSKHDEVVLTLPEDDDIDDALDAEQAKLEEHVSSLCRRLKLLSQKAHARNYSMKFREVSNDIANIADAAAAISDPGAQTGRIDALQEMLTPLQEQLQTLRSRVECDCSVEQCLELL